AAAHRQAHQADAGKGQGGQGIAHVHLRSGDKPHLSNSPAHGRPSLPAKTRASAGVPGAAVTAAPSPRQSASVGQRASAAPWARPVAAIWASKAARLPLQSAPDFSAIEPETPHAQA